MSYQADDHVDGISETIHIMSNFGVVYRSACVGRSCDECHTDRDLYRVCPGCGGPLPESAIGVTLCGYGCGTAMWVCGYGDSKLVTTYATSNQLFKTDEGDSI